MKGKGRMKRKEGREELLSRRKKGKREKKQTMDMKE